MTENVKLQVDYQVAAEMLDPKSVTQIVIAALRNVVGLALGAAMDDGRFDERVAMILASGIQVAVGEQTFWVNVFPHGDARVEHLASAAVLAASEECEHEATRLAARMPDGGMVWKDGDLLAQGARHCAAYVRVMAPSKPYGFINELHELRKRDERWRRVVETMLDSTVGSRTLRTGLEHIVDEPDERLTEEGRAARDAYREFQSLMMGV